jgi:dihydrofolate reductase
MATPQVQCSVFIGTSVDGFIARSNGGLDFLPEGGGEPHGYSEFIATIDAIVIGRKTFETVRAFPEWPYGEKQVIVLSTGTLDFSALRDARVEQMSGPPLEIVSKLGARGFKHLYIDGGTTVQQFLRAGLIQRLIITRVPVLIGEGIALFGTLPHDIRLKHIETRSYSSGLVKTEYEVLS